MSKTAEEAMIYATSCVGLSCNLSDAKSRVVVEAAIKFLELAGWVCVPKVQTNEMHIAGDRAYQSPAAIWLDMLATAPRLPGVDQ